MNILVLEDDPDIRELICQSLSLAEYNTHGCADIGMAKRALDDFEPDCIIVDWMLADSSGLEFIRWLRRQQAYRNTPTLMLTAKSQEPDKIMGLESGADDYMTKPMSLRELHARVKALLRRPSIYVEAGDLLQIGSLELNRKTREVQIDQQPVDLTKTEFKLLKFFIENRDRVFTRDQILNAIWGSNAYPENRTVDVQILRLRKILKNFGKHHMIHTVRGVGYRFSEKVA